MIIVFAVVLIFIIPIVLVWVHIIDKAVDNDAWNKQNQQDRQEEYLRRYTIKQQEKRERKERKNATKRRRQN